MALDSGMENGFDGRKRSDYPYWERNKLIKRIASLEKEVAELKQVIEDMALNHEEWVKRNAPNSMS